jgi:hypothetical protein
MKKNAFINFLQNQCKNTNNCCVPFVIRKNNSPKIEDTRSINENLEELCFSLISNILNTSLESIEQNNENDEQKFTLSVDYDVCKELAKEGKQLSL